MAGVGGLWLPGQLAHRQTVAVGRQESDLVSLDLDAHTGKNRQGVATVSRDRHLGNRLGKDVTGDGAAEGWGGRQGGVVVGRHQQQAESTGTAGDLDLVAVGPDVDGAVRKVARDVGQ